MPTERDSESKTSEWIVDTVHEQEDGEGHDTLADVVERHTVRQRRSVSDIIEDGLEAALDPPSDVYYTAQVILILITVLFTFTVTTVIVDVVTEALR